MFHISLGVTYIYSICIDGTEYINRDYKKMEHNGPEDVPDAVTSIT